MIPKRTRLVDLFDAARTLHRTGDRATSVEAAQSIVPRITAIQRQVLDYARLHPEGFTDREMTTALGHGGGSTYRTRRAELTAKGLIEDTGRVKQHPPSHRWHVVWEAKR